MKNEETSKQPNYLLAIFIILQVVFVLIAIFITPGLFQDNRITSDNNNKQPRIHIAKLDSISPELPNGSANAIQRKLFSAIQENVDNINVSSTKATIRGDSVKTYPDLGKSGLDYVSAIIDVPDLGQSYRLFFEYNSEVDNWTESPHELFLITCLNELDQIIYPDFKCHDSYGPNLYNGIVAKYIKNLGNDQFSMFVSNENITELYINPYYPSDDSFETHKQDYIDKAKNTIESLGIPSEIFTYHFPDYSNLDYELY